MTFHTNVSSGIDPELFKKRVTRAAHAVAAMAARDMQELVPAASGALRASQRINGRIVSWTAPYARALNYGTLYVDPTFLVGGFPVGNSGKFFSRPGVKKIPSDRKLTYHIGERNWIREARLLYGDRWLKLARKELMRRG